jgi:hypothetical protein
MKHLFKLLLSAIIFFGAVPTVQATDMNMAGMKASMEEVKKKKKKKGKKIQKGGKKKKKGFFSKMFGSK